MLAARAGLDVASLDVKQTRGRLTLSLLDEASRTGRLGMNMVAHASFNLVAVLTILSQRGGLIH